MKRLIRQSNKDLNSLISDLSSFVSKGIEGIDNRESLNSLIDDILSLVPEAKISGTFFRGLLLNENLSDFVDKISSLRELLDECDEFVDNETDEVKIQNEREKYKNSSIPSEIIQEIKDTCMQSINMDNSYYSFAKTFDACFNFLYNAAPDAYDGEVLFIFECNTEGLDIKGLYDKINDLDITDEVKSKFEQSMRFFGYQEEVICKMKDPKILNFNEIDLNGNMDLLTFVNRFNYDIY